MFAVLFGIYVWADLMQELLITLKWNFYYRIVYDLEENIDYICIIKLYKERGLNSTVSVLGLLRNKRLIFLNIDSFITRCELKD